MVGQCLGLGIANEGYRLFEAFVFVASVSIFAAIESSSNSDSLSVASYKSSQFGDLRRWRLLEEAVDVDDGTGEVDVDDLIDGLRVLPRRPLSCPSS